MSAHDRGADRAAPSILLYDGDCGFCSRGVLFAYARDPKGWIRFASLQGDVGRALLAEHALPSDLGTVVLIDEKGAHVRSTAVLRTARLLRWPWSWAYAFVALPRPLRDWGYRQFAKHRHRWGPAVAACEIPTPGLRARMLDR